MNDGNESVVTMDNIVIESYFDHLTGRLFKILPRKEDNDETLSVYMRSLQLELLGFSSMIDRSQQDARLVSLTSILQSLIDDDLDTEVVRREVFHLISICGKLRKRYASHGSVPVSAGGADRWISGPDTKDA